MPALGFPLWRRKNAGDPRLGAGRLNPYNQPLGITNWERHLLVPPTHQAEQGEPKMMMIRTLLLTLALAMGVSACSVWRGQETVKEYTSDAAITTSVKTSFAKDPAVAATSIGVETMDGIVQLSGFAKTAEEKSRAEALAKQANGVKSVRNNIIVRP
jgi:hypothetical protein